MAQPAVVQSDDRTDLLGVPVYWETVSAEPPFPWETWVRQFFLAISIKEGCDPNVLLSIQDPVFDDPPPNTEAIPTSETPDQTNIRTARDAAAIRIVTESNSQRRKKDPKSAQTRIITKRTTG